MECLKPVYLHKREMEVPCGKCPFCLATKRSDWALRLHYEGRLHYDKKFLTLTYADPHLHWKGGVSQLDKRDLQLFFKRVRKTGAKIRYFAVGEYGSKTFRPHYHIILFGDVSANVIRDAWPLGHVHIGQVTEASVMYTLGYIINGKGWKMSCKREPPFSLMSRGNGIPGDKFQFGLGHNYLSPAMIAWHRSGRKNYAQIYNEKRHLPRYYKVKIFSKIDLVRIAVRDQKETFKKMVAWVRSPAMRRQADPLAYRQQQLEILAKRIRAKCKQNLII